MTYPDIAEALQARLRAHREADRHSLQKLPDSDERRRIEALEAQIATLEDAIANTEALGERQRQEAGTAVKRVEALEADIVTLKEVVAKAQALAEERRQEAESAARRVEALAAQIATLEKAVANAEAQRQDCKAVVVTSTAESMRMLTQRGVEGDEMRRTEGTLALAKLKQNEPRVLRNPVAPEESVTSKALRDC